MTPDIERVVAGNPPVAKLTAEPSVVWNGSLVTLTWQCRRGDHCVLRQDGVTIADNLALVSRRTVVVQDSSNFEITCVGAGIATAAAGVTKSVPNIEFERQLQVRCPATAARTAAADHRIGLLDDHRNMVDRGRAELSRPEFDLGRHLRPVAGSISKIGRSCPESSRWYILDRGAQS